jgi:hypothetical protein
MNLQELSDWSGTTEELFDRLTHELAAAGRWHELFEARLVEARARLGLSLADSPSLDELPEPVRNTLENDYTAACREVGGLLVDAGRLREAWQYLRPAGEKQLLQAALSRVVPTPENIEQLIELALYEGVDIERGFGWLLGHCGTCSAITTLEGIAPQLPPERLAACAAVLVRHLDHELRDSLRRHIADREPPPANTQTVGDLIANRDWLFDAEASHVDASHLAATIRYARVCTNPRIVETALDLTEYGSRLAPSLQYAGDAPFEQLYPAHRHFFLATLGRDSASAIDYFRQRAELSDPHSEGTAAIETLLVLLDRTGQPSEALGMYEQLVPAGVALSPFAPRLVDLAEKADAWPRYESILRKRDDPVGLAIGYLARSRKH